MCGIIGVMRYSGEASGFTSKNLMPLRHRGPDGQGVFSEGHVTFGHTRLSIIDLSECAAQPMTYLNGRYVITFNGEVYNYLELRKELCMLGEIFVTNSDTEVILAAYHVWGEDCVHRFRGMFAFAIWDRKDKSLFLARDRCGERPLIYYQDDEYFVFASEFKGLVPILPIQPKLEPAVVDMYLHYQYVPEPFTLLKGVQKLPAAHHVTIRVSKSAWRACPVRYWSVENSPQLSLPADEAGIARYIRDTIEEAVIMNLRADVPVAVALSGGIDSSAIAVFAQRNYPEPMHAFSVGYPGKPPYDERDEARELAKTLGLIFHEVELPVDDFISFFPHMVHIMDEPIADPAAFGHYAVPRAASELGIKVLLTGIGGDELFYGYPWVRQSAVNNQRLEKFKIPQFIRPLLTSESLQRILGRFASTNRLSDSVRNAAALLQWAAVPVPNGQMHFLGTTPDFAAALRYKGSLYGPALASLAPNNPYRPTDIGSRNGDDIPIAVQRLLFDTWLVGNCLTLGDRVSLAVGVEARLPFLDVELIERVTAIRRLYPDHHMGHKARLRTALKGVVPDEVLNRPKRGFQPPVWEWLSGVVGQFKECLPSGHLIETDMLDKQAVLTLCKTYNNDWSKLFMAYKLVLLEMWYKHVLDRRGYQ